MKKYFWGLPAARAAAGSASLRLFCSDEKAKQKELPAVPAGTFRIPKPHFG